jgi:hypothetical protein
VAWHWLGQKKAGGAASLFPPASLRDPQLTQGNAVSSADTYSHTLYTVVHIHSHMHSHMHSHTNTHTYTHTHTHTLNNKLEPREEYFLRVPFAAEGLLMACLHSL